MAHRKKTGRELGTQANFKLKGGLKPIRKFDDSDLSELRNSSDDVNPKMNNPESGSVIPRAVPSHLLMISILEHLCFMYTKSGVAAHKLFKVLCEHLTKLRVMSPLSGIDEMSGIRAHYRTSIHNMIQAAMTDLYKKGEIFALPPTMEFGNLKLKHQLTRVRTEDLINMQTSRYEHEFIELEILGKGGFGSVYKVQNRLDGRSYAVKKIRFKHKKPEHLLKVLKEVKALANFQHTNIVGYNAAWLEYDFPSTHSSRCSSSLAEHSVSQDKSFSHIEEGNSSSIDVEFRLDSCSEDELDDFNGKIIHKHFNSSKCTITEITEITSPRKSPGKNDVHRLSSSKTIIKNMIPIVPGNYINARFLDNIPEGHSRYKNIHAKDRDSLNVAMEKNCDSSHSSDIIFLDDNDEIQNSSSQNLVGRDRQNVSQSASENSNYVKLRHYGENESASSLESLRNIQDSSNVCVNDKPTIFRNQISHKYCIQASTDAPSTGVSIPKIKKEENSTPSSVSPKNRLVPFRRSISAEPLSNKNVVNDFHEYSDDNFPYQATISLFIQMELCEQTLQMWLFDRNSKLACVEDLKQYKEQNMRIIHQILTGVNYIHSLGLIHRDLKPRNIFLLGNNLHVKIGDFGLATEDVIRGEVKDTILTPSPDIKAYFKYDNLTSGVGTEMYAAPEQLDGHHYDSKSDIYSIGVILFEEFQVFKTEMERLISIQNLRGGTIPDLLKSFWPDVARAIKAMTSVNVSDRPTAECLLDSQLYLSKDQMIVSLQKQLAEKSDYITQLEKQIQEKDDLNYKLKIQLDQLSQIKF